MKIVGLILILTFLLFAIWWIITRNTRNGSIIAITGFAVFAGLAIMLEDRITELTVKGVGTIKAAAQQVTSDARAVTELKDRVENQSATVDLVATLASRAKEISERVAENNKLAEQKLEIVDNAIKEANVTVEQLKSVADFTTIVLAAQNDDRKAFDKLKQLAEDKTQPFSNKAEQAWSTIFEAHSKGFFESFTVPWKEGLDPSKLSLAELAQQYQFAPAQLKPALLEYIWKRSDIPKLNRLDFLMNVMKSDTSLTAVEYAGRYFTEGTGQKIKPLAVEYLAQWWDEHRQEFNGQ